MCLPDAAWCFDVSLAALTSAATTVSGTSGAICLAWMKRGSAEEGLDMLRWEVGWCWGGRRGGFEGEGG